MFQKMKLGSALSYLARATNAADSLSPSAVEKFFGPAIPIYAKKMKALQLTGDQAAVLMVSEQLSTFTFAQLYELQQVEPDLFRRLGLLFVGALRLAENDPERFADHFVNMSVINKKCSDRACGPLG